MDRVVVVGAGLAGLSAVRALRDQGYAGELIAVGAERHLPYDRPPLSKGFLTGAATQDALTLLSPDDEALAVDWRLGAAATALSADGRRVVLADGSELTADGVVIATGARARGLPGTAGLRGVYLLRSREDAVALRAALATAGRVVVVGAGFIGAEVASSARSLGLDVTVVEAMATPLAAPLGPEMGAMCGRLHTDHGVTLLTGVGVSRILADGRATGVELADGRALPADVVVVGIGAQPNVEWLAGSGLQVGDASAGGGVLTDAAGATAVPGVVAVGDCASFFDPALGRHTRIEHWTHALQQPAVAAAALLAGGTAPVPHPALPYFWSEQYGIHVQFAGHREPGDLVTVVEGSAEQGTLVATYEREGRLVAVLGLGAPSLFNRWRRRLRAEHAARYPVHPAG